MHGNTLNKFTRLYIIGNGFDLHHGIHSSYNDFQNWMNENHPDIINKVEEIYGNCNNDWWSDFEHHLASLDAIKYGERIAFENEPDLLSEHCDRMWSDAQIEVERQLNELFSEIRICFHDWIRDLNPPVESKRIKLIAHNSAFLNFNYTQTLEDFYGINYHNILHIHGCVDENENFVLGHGKTYKELIQLNENANNRENGHMLHEQLAVEAAIKGVANQRKPVENLMRKYEYFFNSLSNVCQIYVYGTSLSDIDMPYYNYILLKIEDVNWEFSYYDNKSINRIKKFCRRTKIKNYNIINLEDMIDDRQLKIPFV